MRALRCGVGAAVSVALLCSAGVAIAQENLDQGKSAAQLFASNCSACHKSPQGLAKAGGILGLDSFLREHYTASKESAGALAAYLKSMDTPAAPARGAKRTAKGDEKSKADEKKKSGARQARRQGRRPEGDGEEAGHGRGAQSVRIKIRVKIGVKTRRRQAFRWKARRHRGARAKIRGRQTKSARRR